LKANPSAKERAEYGRSRRDVVSRAAQANLRPKERRFDPMETLRASGRDRLPALLPLKYGRMKTSPFAFFRGAVSVMAADLGRLPHSGLMVQLCGDAHVQNMGSFAAPDGKLVFDLNDFDETIRGPWEWDVKRMAASIVLAGRESAHDRVSCRSAAEAFGEGYLGAIEEFSRAPILAVARGHVHRERRVGPIQAALRQSERAHPLDLLPAAIRFSQLMQQVERVGAGSPASATCVPSRGGFHLGKLAESGRRSAPIAATSRPSGGASSTCSAASMRGSKL